MRRWIVVTMLTWTIWVYGGHKAGWWMSVFKPYPTKALCQDGILDRVEQERQIHPDSFYDHSAGVVTGRHGQGGPSYRLTYRCYPAYIDPRDRSWLSNLLLEWY